MRKIRNVFCLVPDCHTTFGYYNRLWRNHFEEGVSEVVDRAVLPTGLNFDWARQPHERTHEGEIAPFRARASEQLQKQIFRAHEAHGLDAVISYCYGRDVEPDLVSLCIARGIPWINFYCDSTHQFEHVERIARVASINWFPEHAALPAYKQLGRPVLCRPYALNPSHLPNCSTQHAIRAAAFIGLPTTNRVQQLGSLLLLGVDLEIRGVGWDARSQFYNPVPKHKRLAQILTDGRFVEKLWRRAVWPFVERNFKGPVPPEELTEYLRGCVALLGLNQGRDRAGRYESYLKFRDLEFPAYGCCYVTQKNPDTSGLFEDGIDALLYESIWEARSKLLWAKSNPDRAREIGKKAREKALRDHTWRTRIGELEKALQ